MPATHIPTRPISRRSLLSMGVGLGAATTLAACSSSPSSGASTAASKKANTTPLTMLILGANEQTVAYLTKTALPAFQKSSGINVQLQTSAWGPAFQKIVTQAASNSLPDVFLIGGIWTAPLASQGVMLDTTDRFNSWADKSQFRAANITDASYKGRMYGIPCLMDVRSGVYRNDLLKTAGVSTLPTTWEQFRDVAMSVKSKSAAPTPIDWGINTSIGLQQSFAQLFLQAGGKYWDSKGKASFNSPAGTKSLTYLVNTYKDGLASYNQVYSGNGPMALTSGQSALTFNGATVQQNAQQEDPKVAGDIVAGPALKATSSSKPTSVAWIDKWVIAKSTKNPDGAWNLLTFLSSKTQMSKIADIYGNLPARKDLMDASWLTPMQKQVLATADDAISQPNNPLMLQLGPAVTQLLEPAIRGTASVPDTLQAIDAKLDSLSA